MLPWSQLVLSDKHALRAAVPGVGLLDPIAGADAWHMLMVEKPDTFERYVRELSYVSAVCDRTPDLTPADALNAHAFVCTECNLKTSDETKLVDALAGQALN